MQGHHVREQEELKRLRIDPESWSWVNLDYSAYQRSETDVEKPLNQSERGFSFFGKKKASYSPSQAVYGNHPTEWGRGASDAGRNPNWIMGFLLNKLTVIPGVTVFHDLKVPGSGVLIDIDHAVLVGNTVYLIDSNVVGFSSGVGWHQNKRGKTISYKGDDGWRHNHIADVSEYYRKNLGQQCTVVPIISVTSPECAVNGERWSPRGVGLFTASELLDFIGSSAAQSLPATATVSETLATVLLTTVK